jgi:hypothetical protein
VLLHDAGLGVIIECPNGVIFSNQTMGNSCWQAEMEGVFVPFDAEESWLRLNSYFEGPKYSGNGAMHGLDDQDADLIDAVVLDARIQGPVVVDRTRLKESHEAWVHVLLEGEERALFAGFGPFPRRGVLTWPNSD